MKATIPFSRSLYSPDAVAATASAWADVLRVRLETHDSEITVTLSDPHPDLTEPFDALCDAFCNHALHETVTRHRAGEVAA